MSTRTRQRLSVFNSQTSGTLQYYGGTPRSYSGLIAYNDLGEKTTDQLTPNYFALKKAGAHLPVNPFTNLKPYILLDTPEQHWSTSMVRTNGSPGGYTGTWFNNQALGYARHYNWLGYRNQPISTTGFPSPPNASRLLQQALANAKTSNFDIGTFLAEAHKTFRLLATVKDTFWRRALTVEKEAKRRYIARRGDPSFLSNRIIDVFNEVWLEGRYGWRQLYFDITNAYEALVNMSKIAEGSLIRFTAYDEDSNEQVLVQSQKNRSVFLYDSSWSNPGENTLWDYKVMSRKTIGVRAGVGVVPRAAGSFGFIDPFVTGWEIIPFSFIVDWFFNVGQAIAAWSPTGRVDLKHGFTTHIHTEDIIITGVPGPVESTSTWTTSANAGQHGMTLRREYVSRVPASPTFNLMFDLNLDVWKIVDLLSIIRPRARRFLRRLNH